MGLVLALSAMTATGQAGSRHATLPGGIFVFTPAGGAVNAVAEVVGGPFQNVQGFDWAVDWAVLEPSEGDYQWTVLDRALSAVASADSQYGLQLTSQITVLPGVTAPSWVINNNCPQVTVTLLHTGIVAPMAVPTSSCFLNAWKAFIVQLGAHLATAPGVTSVQASGLGDQGEMTLSPPIGTTWARVGVTTASLLAGWEQVLTTWHASLPASIPAALAIEEPLGIDVSDVLRPLIPWVHSQFGSSVWIQQNALRATTSETTGYWPILRKASRWTDTGWQMFGFGAENGDLETAFKIGLASHARYFQIYLADILDPTQTAALEYLASRL